MNRLKELLFLKQLKGFGNAAINSLYEDRIQSCEGLDDCVQLVTNLYPSLSTEEISRALGQASILYEKVISNSEFSVITMFDPQYPARLLSMRGRKPVYLFIKGNPMVLETNTLSVVGTRNPSVYSQKIAPKIVKKVIEKSHRTIVSGLALGCDKIAHESAIRANSPTIAVLPSGVNKITPASHTSLSQEIINTGGCLISEYLPNEKPTNYSYVERDRIIAALGDGTIVIECGVKSGTMHTVKAAVEMERKIGCFMPKDLVNGMYEGNTYMVREMNAIPIFDTPPLAAFLADLPSHND